MTELRHLRIMRRILLQTQMWLYYFNFVDRSAVQSFAHLIMHSDLDIEARKTKTRHIQPHYVIDQSLVKSVLLRRRADKVFGHLGTHAHTSTEDPETTHPPIVPVGSGHNVNTVQEHASSR